MFTRKVLDYWQGYKRNVKVIGSPTINNSIVDGWSASDCLQIPETFTPTGSWEAVFKRTSAGFLQCLAQTNNRWSNLMSVSDKIWLGVKSGNSHAVSLSGSTTLEDVVWVKFEYTGTIYNVYYSYNGTDWVLDGSATSSVKMASMTNIGQATDSATGNTNSVGGIDLSECYIKQNGEYWWKGVERNEKYINATVVGSPTINGTEVSSFSSSNYLTVPYYYPLNSDVEWNFKIRTGSDVTTRQFFATVNSTFCFCVGVNSGTWSHHYSSNGTSWNLANSVSGASVLPNTTYYFKISSNSTGTTISYSADGINYIVDKTYGSMLYGNSNMTIRFSGERSSTNAPWLGTIYFDECNYKIGDFEWWNGAKYDYVLSGTPTDYDYATNVYKYYMITRKVEGVLSWTRPNLTSNGTMGGYSFACDSSSTNGANFQPWRAFDNGVTYCWASANNTVPTESSPQWISFYNPNKIKISQIVIQQCADAAYFALPSEGILQGSNDNSSWVDLAPFTNTDNSGSAGIVVDVDDENQNFYNYYRVYITGRLGSQSYVALGEITMTAIVSNNVYKYYAITRRDEKAINANIIGSPTINGTNVSGFSTSSYLQTTKALSSLGNDFELLFSYTTGSDITQETKVFSTSTFGYGINIAVSSGYIYVDGYSSYNTVLFKGDGYLCNTNTKYYTKITFDGSSYKIYHGTSIDNLTLHKTVTSSTQVALFGVGTIGYIPDFPNLIPFFGTVHMSECYMKTNGQYLWKGTGIYQYY